jgi:hypothetical protein
MRKEGRERVIKNTSRGMVSTYSNRAESHITGLHLLQTQLPHPL